MELTVSDSAQAVIWRRDVIGFAVVREFRRHSFEGWVMAHPSGIGLCVVTHEGTHTTGEFDEQRVGLDHLSFRVADNDELKLWVAHLDANGVVHSRIIDAGFGPTVVFRDPDNVQLELYVHSSVVEDMMLSATGSAAGTTHIADLNS